MVATGKGNHVLARSIGLALKEAREEAGFKLWEMAQKLVISEGQLSYWENGRRWAEEKNLYALLVIYANEANKSPWDILSKAAEFGRTLDEAPNAEWAQRVLARGRNVGEERR